MSALTGTLEAAGAPVAGAFVLAAAIDGDAVLAVSATGDDGRFALDVEPGRARLVARAGAGEAVGVAARTVDVPPPGPVALALDDHAPLHPVTVRVEGDVPPELDVQLAPRRIDGVDDDALSLLHVPVGGADRPMLVSRPAARPVELRMQAGGWLIYAAHDTLFDARGADTPARSWRVARAVLDSGEELAPAVVGFALEVAGPLTVTLHMICR